MHTISSFLSNMDVFVHEQREYYSASDVAKRVNEIESGLIVEGDGLLMAPYIREDWMIPWFPYGFYVEKVDSPQVGPGELMLSSGFTDLVRTDYCAFHSEEPYVSVARLHRYLTALENRYNLNLGANRGSIWNGMYFRFIVF